MRFRLASRAAMTSVKPLQAPTRSRSSSRKSSASSSSSKRSNSCASSTRSKVSVGLKTPVLGKNFRIPDLYSELEDIQLDDTMPYIPVYCHFIVPEIEPIVRPTTPPILKALRAELEELNLIKPTKPKSEQSKSRSTPQNYHRQSSKNQH